MQKIVFLLLFVLSALTSFSQQGYFVFLQAEHPQPFYARVNSKMYSSSESGYIIIPNLTDGVYNFIIGFARNALPEQNFTVAINKKDKGFQLKDLGSKGWALVNLQNLSVISNSGLPVQTGSDFSGIKKTDAFSEMLARVVNDTAILYSSVKQKPQESSPTNKAADITAKLEPIQDKDSASNSTTALDKPSNNQIPNPEDLSTKPFTGLGDSSNVVADASSKSTKNLNPALENQDSIRRNDPGLVPNTSLEKPFITRIEEKKTGEAYQAIYLEQYNFSTDTIMVVIPLTESTVSNDPNPVINKVDKPEPSSPVRTTEEKIISTKPVTIDSSASARKTILLTNSDCKEVASDYDVDKLRVKLISNKTIAEKMTTAKKYFKNKCLLVKQVRALTELFPSDETKYNFFSLSYPFVSDTGNYYLLEDLLENTFYKNQFKTMLNN